MRRVSGKNKKSEDDNTSTKSIDGSENDERPIASDNADDSTDKIEDNAEAENGEKSVEKISKPKKGRKSNSNKKPKNNSRKVESDAEDEEQYEVEKVMDCKKVKNVVHYLIRWKGYSASSDTWEPESTLSCPDLIKQFHDQKGDDSKKRKSVKDGKSKRTSKKTKLDNSDSEEEKEYEVEKIEEVHHLRKGGREFLVRWKGFPPSDSTWEPEEHLNCPDLIQKFMDKVENAKNHEQKELRLKRTHTERFTLSTRDSGRRLSRRNQGRQRISYYDTE